MASYQVKGHAIDGEFNNGKNAFAFFNSGVDYLNYTKEKQIMLNWIKLRLCIHFKYLRNLILYLKLYTQMFNQRFICFYQLHTKFQYKC